MFVTPLEVMRGAEQNTYLGHYSQSEAKELVNRHFSVTKGTDYLIHLLAHDIRFGYDGKVSAVVRHAVELLLQYYTENHSLLGAHGGFASEILRTQHEMRLAAHRAKMRKEFRENISVFDEEMMEAVKIGDFAYIAHRLTAYSAMLRGCESIAQKNALIETLARSVATRTAVSAFYDWVMSPAAVRPPEWNEVEWHKLAVTWQRFYEDEA
jgi:hypothetical protein